MNELRIEALEYARAGWHIIPLEPGSSEINRELDVLPDESSMNRQIIDLWWKVDPKADIGIVTGKKIWRNCFKL